MRLGFFGLLTALFVVLKLTDVIDWSWWLITLPIFAGFCSWCVRVVLIAIAAEIKKKEARRR